MNTTVSESATLTPGAVDAAVSDAAASYRRLPRALRDAHPVALKRALSIAKGNPRRLVVEDDGSITVVNYTAW